VRDRSYIELPDAAQLVRAPAARRSFFLSEIRDAHRRASCDLLLAQSRGAVGQFQREAYYHYLLILINQLIATLDEANQFQFELTQQYLRRIHQGFEGIKEAVEGKLLTL